MPKLLLLVIVIVVVGFAGYYLMGQQQPAPATDKMMVTETMETSDPSAMMDDGHTITLNEQNASGEMGVATLKEVDGKTVVTLDMKGAPETTPQPAHIHVGSCPDVGAVAYPLTNVVNGMSETTLDVTLAELAAKQPLGINVHKSAAESKVYVSCGDLNLAEASPEAMEKETQMMDY